MVALERLHHDIRHGAPVYRAPEALRRQLRSMLRREAAASAPSAPRAAGWLAYAASMLIAIAVGSGGTVLLTGERQNDTVANEVIDRAGTAAGDTQGPLWVCAVTRRRFPVGASPTRRFAPAGSNRSRHGGDEMSEAFG